MAKPTAEQYYEAFKQAYPKLKDALPINDLLPYFFKGGIVPGYLKEKLDSIPVCSDKVVCLLDKMERGLRAGIVDQFESFICVMEEFATDNNDIVVKKLTEDIRSIINKPTVKQSSSTNHEIPGRSVFSLFIHSYFIGLQDNPDICTRSTSYIGGSQLHL